MCRRITSLFIVLFVAATSRADFMVYLSEKTPNEFPIPGPLHDDLPLTGMGNLYLYGDGTTQLSGLSLDLAITAGTAVKFTSATVNNPGGRWSFLDGPLVVTDSLITNIGGAAIPPGAPGVGGPVADEVPAPPGGFLLATIGYMVLNTSPATLPVTLQLRVGSNLIADYEGNPAQVRFGGPNGTLVDGGVQGAAGFVGSIVHPDPEPATLKLFGVAVFLLVRTRVRRCRELLWSLG